MAVQTAQKPIFVGVNRLDVSSYEANWKIRDTDVSTSATAGTRYAPVRGDYEATIRLPLDSANAPEAAGLELGSIIPEIYFETYDGFADLLENCLVTSMPKTVNSENDVPRIVISVKGGDLTVDVPL